jgi:hypothetical protein
MRVHPILHSRSESSLASGDAIQFGFNSVPKDRIVGHHVRSEACNDFAVPAQEEFLKIPKYFWWRCRQDSKFAEVFA